MPTVAEQLRAAREARHLSVQQVADITKIRTDHIRALEEGNYDMFAAPVYIRGFVRTYATLLKLDVPQVMAALDAELARTEKFNEPPSLSPPPQGALDLLVVRLARLNWRRLGPTLVILILLAFVATAYWFWRHRAQRDPLRQIAPTLLSPQDASGETLPLPPARP
ncbi:MAG: helix-turn-helix domain-containing protein [Verrucomicrobiae bacterium]|nr:helix-turn-helix domain-containing protein [Verrucomicrobiae bacterium]